jgi:hypothetical protein
MRLKHGINVASRPARVVGQRHGRATDYVDIRDHTASREAVTQSAESFLDGRTIEQRTRLAHATFSSSGATYTPRRRKAAGA